MFEEGLLAARRVAREQLVFGHASGHFAELHVVVEAVTRASRRGLEVSSNQIASRPSSCISAAQ
jgi:hypothetical protein